MSDSPDRRDQWQLRNRPGWVAETNRLGPLIDMKAVVPLDEDSLLDHARRNTGLDDFGEDGWRDHFRMLLKAIEEEAELNLIGRLLTRSDMLTYLEIRLQVQEAYKRHPEIDDEVITEPVFILGLGRSGTTILHETLSQDPQFRSVRRWEALFPWPAPEEATYETDPRIQKAADRVEFVHSISPEWRSVHAWGAEIPLEDIEFTYPAFFSEVWPLAFQIPSFERYFNERSPDDHFAWHKRFLKLLQWKFKKPHWLLKNPTHMPRIPALLKFYPDAKIILPHRDPIASADSVINVEGIIYSWRTDKIYGEGGTADEWFEVEPRVKMWDDVIALIDSGTLRKGYVANILYADFVREPLPALERLYRDLKLPLEPEVLARMGAFLDERNQGSHGNKNVYAKSEAADPRTLEERRLYKRYQDYFGVPNER
jgi:hypothetical protein